MKNLLLTIALFVTALSFAQDGYKLAPETYEAITAKVSELDTLRARAFADRLAGTAPTGFVYMQTKTTDNATKYYYKKAAMSSEEKQDLAAFGCSDCLVVYFKNVNNSLQFDQVTGRFEDLYPTWNREFLPSATVDNVNQSFKYREVKDRTTGTDIRFGKVDNTWQIYNWTK